jgi:hypothetical protein
MKWGTAVRSQQVAQLRPTRSKMYFQKCLVLLHSILKNVRTLKTSWPTGLNVGGHTESYMLSPARATYAISGRCKRGSLSLHTPLLNSISFTPSLISGANLVSAMRLFCHPAMTNTQCLTLVPPCLQTKHIKSSYIKCYNCFGKGS